MNRVRPGRNRWSAASPAALGVLALTVVIGWVQPTAAQSSASLRIGGVVLGVNRITIDPQPGHDSLNLAQGVQGATVASVTEQSNSATGYDVKLTSLNARASGVGTPLLKRSASATNVIAYAIAYGAAGQETPVLLDVQGTASVTQARAKTGAAGAAKNIKVTVPQGAPAPDAYSDTLVLTIASK